MNYHGPTGGSFRVLRSGSWLVNAYSCRVANRNYYYPDLEDDTYGFRSVVSVTGQ
jgi:formylglycine-generating enzyme required for sulfatase activity